MGIFALCRTTAGSVLYSYGEANAREDVWMSHGDSVVQLPPGFSVVAKSDQVTHPASCGTLQESCCTRDMAVSSGASSLLHCSGHALHCCSQQRCRRVSVLTEAMPPPAWCCQDAAISQNCLQRCLC